MEKRECNHLSARRFWAMAFCAVLVFASGCATTWPKEIEVALEKAGYNRGQLEKVLKHYQQTGDEQKLAAAQFLLKNMEGHGFVLAGWYDEDKNEIEFEALDCPNFKEALAAFEALEEQHGSIDYRRKDSTKDLETVTSELLIENIDLAFQAWHEKPWAKDLSFEAFCEYILPYRGSNEPVNSFRPVCLERYADLPDRMEDPTDVNEAARLIRQDVHKWVRFRELYYLHPTDQSFDEMRERGAGRCEDISNMMMYAMRANAVPSTSDYTPWWANRDNNHAWEVTLDKDGRGKAGLANVAAKIYRKTFAIQRDNLVFRKGPDEQVPRWLAGKNYKDVTEQYMDTTDVMVALEKPQPEKVGFAYLCVFNGGDWQAIHWGPIEGNRATFTKMGRGIAYLPAYYVEDELTAAGSPFILGQDGSIHTLDGDGQATVDIEITVTKPDIPDADLQITKPRIVVEPGKTYELFVWGDGQWDSLGKQIAGDEPVAFKAVPANRLYWLVEEDSRRLERIFTIEEGRQKWW